MSGKPLIVTCIPAYNEEGTIAGVVLRALRHVDRVRVCGDGLKDVIAEIVEGLRRERALGKGVACGGSLSVYMALLPMF